MRRRAGPRTRSATLAIAVWLLAPGARCAAALPIGPLTVQWRACFPPPELDDVDVEASDGQVVAPAPDGGVFVAGMIDNDATGSSDLLVAKYRPDGTLDPAFGRGSGFTTHHRQEANEDGDLVDLDLEARAIAADRRGNVYVAAIVLGDARLGSTDALTVAFGPTGALAWEDSYNKNLGSAESPDYGDEELQAIVVDEQRGEVDAIGTVQGDGTQGSNVLVLRYPLSTTNPARDRRRKELHLGGEEAAVAAALGPGGELYVAAVRPGKLTAGGYEFVDTPPCPGAHYYPGHGYARSVPWVAGEGADAVLAKWIPGATAPSWSVRYGYSEASFARTLWRATAFEVGPPPDFPVSYDCTGYVVRTFASVTYPVHGSDDVPLGLTVDTAGNPVLKVRVYDGTAATVVARFSRQTGSVLPTADGTTRGSRLPVPSTTAGLAVEDTGDVLVTSAGDRLLVSRAAADGRVTTLFDGAGQLAADGSLALAGDALYVTDDLCATRLVALAVPAAPSDLAVEPVRDPATHTISVTLTWRDNADTERGFVVERSVDGVVFIAVLDLGPDATTATQAGLSPATRYTYRVRAWNAAGSSSYSNRATAAVEATTGSPPAAPTDLRATASAGLVQLAWQDNSGDESFFSIERSAFSQSFAVVGTTPPDAAAFVDRAVAPGVAYTYRVVAVRTTEDGLLASSPAVVTVATPAPIEDAPTVADLRLALDAAPTTEISAPAVRALRRLLTGVERILARAAALEQANRIPAAEQLREQAAVRLTGRTRATGWRDGTLRLRMARFVRKGLLAPTLEGRLRTTADRVASGLRTPVASAVR